MSDQGGAPPGESWFWRVTGPTLESWRLAKGLGRVENSAEVEERGEKRGGPTVEIGEGREGGGKGAESLSWGRNPGPPWRSRPAKRFCRWKELSGRGGSYGDSKRREVEVCV